MVPLTWPAWQIEALNRRRGGSFAFNLVNSTPYFAAWGVGTTAVVVWVGNLVVAAAALYVLTLMELVALGVSLMLAVSRPGHVQDFMLIVARRRRPGRLVQVSVPTVYGALVALTYSTWYFASVAFFLHRHFNDYYTGIEASKSSLGIFWQFLYFSFTTVTTLGGPVEPARFASELLVVMEVVVGIFFFLFLLGAMVSRYLGELH